MSIFEGPISAEPIDLLNNRRSKNVSFNNFLNRELFVRSGEIKAEAGLIGSVLINSETVSNNSKEKNNKLAEKPVRLLSRQELQQISQKIEINGSNLWQIYMNKLIGENGLRRVLSEYFKKGGSTMEVLRQEIMEHDIDFERDPSLRDMAVSLGSVESSNIASSEEVLNNMLIKAEESLGSSSNDKLSVPDIPINYKSNYTYSSNRSYFSDKLFIYIILSLILNITLIYFIRH